MPTKPSLFLAVPTLGVPTFTANVSGDAGVTNRLFYRTFDTPDSLTATGPTCTGNGQLTVSGLDVTKSYLVYVVADDGTTYSLPAVGTVSFGGSTTVIQAIKQLWYSDASLVAFVPGGLWEGEVPETVNTLPYAYLDCGRVNYKHSIGFSFEFHQIDIHVYCVGAANAEAAALNIKRVFDWTPNLSVADPLSLIHVMPVDYQIVCEMVRYKDTELIYRAMLSYEVLVQRTSNP